MTGRRDDRTTGWTGGVRHFLTLALACSTFFSATPVLAADINCACKGPGETDTTCLTIDSQKLTNGQRMSGPCARLPSVVTSLQGWSCEPNALSASKERPIAQGGVCAKGPMSAYTAGSAPGGETVSPAAAAGAQNGAANPRNDTSQIIPDLNVQIGTFEFEKDNSADTSSLLAQYIAGTYNYLISIAAVAATIMFTWGAFRYLLGSSKAFSIERGKEIMKDAVIGLLLVFGAHMILRTVNPATLTLEALYIKGVSPIYVGNYQYFDSPGATGPATGPGVPSIERAAIIKGIYDGAKMFGNGVNPCLVLAICEHESNFRPIWNGYPNSPRENARAFGPCQIRAKNFIMSGGVYARVRAAFPDFPQIPAGELRGAAEQAVGSWLMNNPVGSGYSAAFFLKVGLNSMRQNEITAVGQYYAGLKSIQNWQSVNPSCGPKANARITDGTSLEESCISATTAVPTSGTDGCKNTGYACLNVKANVKNEYEGHCADGKKCYAATTGNYVRSIQRRYPKFAQAYDCKPGDGNFQPSAAPASSVGSSGIGIAAGQRVLLIGDSLSLGLASPLRTLARAEGVQFDSAGQSGSVLSQWGGSGGLNATLQQKLAANPTVVIVSLGTNDAYLSPASAQAEVPQLDNLISQIQASGAKLAWIGPPSLPPIYNNNRPDFGILNTIKGKVTPYFASDQYVFPRSDTLHPTGTGYADWAAKLWSWLH